MKEEYKVPTDPHTLLEISETANQNHHLRYDQISTKPDLRGFKVIHGIQGANFRIPTGYADALYRYWSELAQVEQALNSTTEVHDNEDRHDDTVRSLFEAEVAKTAQKSLAELKAMIESRRDPAAKYRLPQPYRIAGTMRDPLVAAYARVRANHRCEIPRCSHELFRNESGLDYVEVHHIKHLAHGGQDTVQNVACLCPAHHREVHFGRNRQVIERELASVSR
ncbi:HNH endonuclease signature motif containing protein [Mesorhizobium sp. M1252]|uniref:HNH endonuclease signature motif containing protein n=1 Tax=Mesorhizobium sp. M1252 TaxID=2957073 RepID=UPI00333D1C11